MTRVHLIGVEYSGTDISGVVVMTTPVYATRYLTANEAINLVRKAESCGGEGIHGLGISNGKLSGSNGALSRYSLYKNGVLQGKFIPVVLNKIGEAGFEIIAPNCRVLKLRENDAVTVAMKYGIANGKVVTRNNSERFISAISGEYSDYEKSSKAEVDPVIQSQMIRNPGAITVSMLNRALNSETYKEIKKAEGQVASNNQSVTGAKTQGKSVNSAQRNIQLRQAVGVSDETKSNIDTNKVQRKAINRIDQIIESAKSVESAALSGRRFISNRGVAFEDSKVKKLKRNLKTGQVIFDEFDSAESALSVEQMIAMSSLQLKACRPLYYAAFRVIKRVESNDLPTMAVTRDKLIYNPEFVVQLTVPQLNFLMLHEMSHILMKHHSRKGKRRAYIFNVACDLYINKAISVETGAILDGPEVSLEGTNIRVQFPSGELAPVYCDAIDIKTDTPEKIYEELMEEVKKQEQGQQGQQGQSGQGQQGQGQSGQGQQGQQDQQGQGQGQQGQGQQGQGQQGQQGQGQNQSGQGQQGQSPSSVTFRGSQINLPKPDDANKGIANDLVDDEDERKNSDETNRQKSDSILQKASVIYKQVLQSSNNRGYGKGANGVVEAFVESELVPKVNWRSIVKNRLIASVSDETSLSTPDRRFIQSGLYVEGRNIEETKLEGIKLCIDTSGSMSDIDIAIAIHQIMQLCKQYNTQADLVYWDDGIQDIVPYAQLTKKDLEHYRATGRGGTNPNCIFAEFSKPEYLRGKKVKASLIVIFTDGYIAEVNPKYKRLFGKDTIWVLCGTGSMPKEQFKPTFGRIAQFLGDRYQ